MSKRIVGIVAVVLVAAMLTAVALCGITIADFELLPLTSSMGIVNRDHEIGDGRAFFITAKMSENSTAEEHEAALEKLRVAISARAISLGYNDVTVSSYDNNKLLVEGNAISATDLAYLTAQGNLTFETADGNVIYTSKNFTAVQPAYGPVSSETDIQYYVMYALDEAGAQALREATTVYSSSEMVAANKNYISVKLDGTVLTQYAFNEPYTETVAQISANFSEDFARYLATTALLGKLDAEMTASVSQPISSMWGFATDKMAVLGFGIGLIIVLVLLLVFYRLCGFAGIVSTISALSLSAILISAFGLKLSTAVIVAIIATLLVALTMNITLFESIKSSLRTGRSASLAVSEGFSATTKAMLEQAGIVAIIAITMLIFGSNDARVFGGALLIAVISAYASVMICTRVILKGFASFRVKNMKLFGI